MDIEPRNRNVKITQGDHVPEDSARTEAYTYDAMRRIQEEVIYATR